jgi:hypothetical protein
VGKHQYHRFNSSPAAVQINGYSETGAKAKVTVISPIAYATDKFPIVIFLFSQIFLWYTAKTNDFF